MRKFLALVVTFLATVSLFLILFNNFEMGRTILVTLISLNLCVLLFPWRNRAAASTLAYARMTSLCIVSALSTWLAIEALFPVVFPQDYSRIRDLTKRFIVPEASGPQGASFMFTNEDQKRLILSDPANEGAVRSRQWHNPGHRFAYYGYDPNMKAKYINVFHWNAQGYYDHDYALRRPDNAFRIVVIGDSYVEAIQVPLSRSFHKLIEASLNSTVVPGQNTRFQVIALGNSGTGQVANFNILRDVAVQYDPDAVVVGLSTNDFCDDDPHLKRELVLASGTITPLIRRLAAHGFFAAAFAVRRVDDLQRNRIGMSPELLQWSKQDLPKVEAAWETTLNRVLAARDFCRARGIKFILVYLSSDIEVKYALEPLNTVSRLKAMGGPHSVMEWDLGKTMRRVHTFCSQHRIPMISLLDPLTEAQRKTGRHVFGDHYTMFGHLVAAQVLSCALASGILADGSDQASLGRCFSQDFWQDLPPAATVASTVQPSAVSLVPAAARGLPAR